MRKMIQQFTFHHPKQIIAPVLWIFLSQACSVLPAILAYMAIYLLGQAFFPPYTLDISAANYNCCHRTWLCSASIRYRVDFILQHVWAGVQRYGRQANRIYPKAASAKSRLFFFKRIRRVDQLFCQRLCQRGIYHVLLAALPYWCGRLTDPFLCLYARF